MVTKVHVTSFTPLSRLGPCHGGHDGQAPDNKCATSRHDRSREEELRGTRATTNEQNKRGKKIL